VGVLASARGVPSLRRRRIEAVVLEHRCSREPNVTLDATRQVSTLARVIGNVRLSLTPVSTVFFEARLRDGLHVCQWIEDSSTQDAVIAVGPHQWTTSVGKRGRDW
jgi:hypothetical protein